MTSISPLYFAEQKAKRKILGNEKGKTAVLEEMWQAAWDKLEKCEGKEAREKAFLEIQADVEQKKKVFSKNADKLLEKVKKERSSKNFDFDYIFLTEDSVMEMGKDINDSMDRLIKYIEEHKFDEKRGTSPMEHAKMCSAFFRARFPFIPYLGD